MDLTNAIEEIEYQIVDRIKRMYKDAPSICAMKKTAEYREYIKVKKACNVLLEYLAR